jgi:two-component system vancomycin resistance associated response regulator VraR
MPPNENRIRTLVVDDFPDFVQAICCFLEVLPNVALIAKGRSGRNAVALAHEWMPDLVLMDIRMPEMTGLKAASELTREMPHVVVVLTSAFEPGELAGQSRRRRVRVCHERALNT